MITPVDVPTEMEEMSQGSNPDERLHNSWLMREGK